MGRFRKQQPARRTARFHDECNLRFHSDQGYALDPGYTWVERAGLSQSGVLTDAGRPA